MTIRADIKDEGQLLHRLRGRRLVRTQGERGSIWTVGASVVAKGVAEKAVKGDRLEAADPGLFDGLPQSFVLRGDAGPVR
jgi:hypothetical protein